MGSTQALTYERIFRRGDLQPGTRRELEKYEQSVTPESYEAGLRHADEARVECAEIFRNCDVLLVPAVLGEAPAALGYTGDWQFKEWSTLRLPCLTLPMGCGPAGLPIGLQLVAGSGEDEKLLRAAAFVEACVGA